MLKNIADLSGVNAFKCSLLHVFNPQKTLWLKFSESLRDETRSLHTYLGGNCFYRCT